MPSLIRLTNYRECYSIVRYLSVQHKAFVLAKGSNG